MLLSVSQSVSVNLTFSKTYQINIKEICIANLNCIRLQTITTQLIVSYNTCSLGYRVENSSGVPNISKKGKREQRCVLVQAPYKPSGANETKFY